MGLVESVMKTMHEEDDVKCEDCGCLLSHSPVYVKESGRSICGDCNQGKEHLTFRNNAYEALAKVCIFPCRFCKSGCKELFDWEEAKLHEMECAYRNYSCFEASCQWTGSKFNMKQHYGDKHSNFLLDLPCVVQPDITITSDTKYLTSEFDLLFVVHVKYTFSSSVLSYYTCVVGEENLAQNFEYQLKIVSENLNMEIKKNVQPISDLHCPKKDNVIDIKLNSLLSTGLIYKYENCKFNLSIKLVNNVCNLCNVALEATAHFFENSVYCNECFDKDKNTPNENK